MMDSKLDKFKKGIINSIGFIVVGAVVAVFMAKNFVEIGKTGKTITEIVADGIFALLFGWAIKMLLGYQGILSGMATRSVQDTIIQHGDAVKKIEFLLPMLPTFCEKENAELRIRKRKLILSKELLNYEDVFCDDPTRLEEAIKEKLETIRDDQSRINSKDLRSKMLHCKTVIKRAMKRRAIHKCVKKANNVRFSELTQHALTTDGGHDGNPYKFPETLAKHMSKKAIMSLPISILFAVVFGYYGYRMVDNPSWATVIGGLIQIGSFCAVGTLQFLKEFIYSTDTYRKGIVRKIDILDRFYAEANELKSKGKGFSVPVEIIKTNKTTEAPATIVQTEESQHIVVKAVPIGKEN